MKALHHTQAYQNQYLSDDFPLLFVEREVEMAAPTKKSERVLCEYQEVYTQVQMLWKQDS